MDTETRLTRLEGRQEETVRRLEKVEDLVSELKGLVDDIRLTLAHIDGSLAIMRWTLPLVVSIGGATVALMALLK